jgi:hypothetical protein
MIQHNLPLPLPLRNTIRQRKGNSKQHAISTTYQRKQRRSQESFDRKYVAEVTYTSPTSAQNLSRASFIKTSRSRREILTIESCMLPGNLQFLKRPWFIS